MLDNNRIEEFTGPVLRVTLAIQTLYWWQIFLFSKISQLACGRQIGVICLLTHKCNPYLILDLL